MQRNIIKNAVPSIYTKNTKKSLKRKNMQKIIAKRKFAILSAVAV